MRCIVSYHYYIRDYQGNNRVIVASNGTVEQQNDYYAYGGPWGNASTNQGFQPFKYNGKELDRIHGLDWYDYGARRYDPACAQFTQMDPLCELYPHLSQYAYCAGNPVNAVDPSGMNPIFNRKGILLGVDDWGMQGDALFFDMDKKDFSLKYSHEEALKLDLGIGSLIDEEAKGQYLRTYNDLPNRPDWDGYITLSEANHWYRHGNGETLWLQALPICRYSRYPSINLFLHHHTYTCYIRYNIYVREPYRQYRHIGCR